MDWKAGEFALAFVSPSPPGGVEPGPAGGSQIQFRHPPNRWIELRMVRDALRINLLPLQPLLAQLYGLGHRRFGRTAGARRQIQFQFVDNPLFENLGVFGDLPGEIALKHGCDSAHDAVEVPVRRRVAGAEICWRFHYSA